MAELMEYKCPSCGGALEFNSGAQKMKCPYCDTEFDVETLKSYDEELKNDSESEMDWQSASGSEWQEGEQEGIRLYSCNSCGGQIMSDESTAATTCPYCGSPVVMKGNLSGVLRPDLVIPFKLDKKAATDAYSRHIQRKPFLPKTFKDKNHIDEIKGVYVPFWLFDTDVSANVRYRAQKVRRHANRNYEYIDTDFYSVVRRGGISFANVPVDSTDKIANDLTESIEPYNFSEAVEFQTAYLSGYFADKYDRDSKESEQRANERIEKSTKDAFASTVHGYAAVSEEHVDIRLKNARARYALLPVWLLNTTWNGKKYTFIMNGQTGKFVGDLPVDRGAFWRRFALLTVIFGAAAYALSWLTAIL